MKNKVLYKKNSNFIFPKFQRFFPSKFAKIYKSTKKKSYATSIARREEINNGKLFPNAHYPLLSSIFSVNKQDKFCFHSYRIWNYFSNISALVLGNNQIILPNAPTNFNYHFYSLLLINIRSPTHLQLINSYYEYG